MRYACRSLRRQPTFTAVAILILVAGIGANTAIFSVIKAVLLNQLPYEDPSRLVVLAESRRHPGPGGAADYLDWKEQSHAIESMAAFRHLRYAFAGRGDPIDVPSVRATTSVFEVLRFRWLNGSNTRQYEFFLSSECACDPPVLRHRQRWRTASPTGPCVERAHRAGRTLRGRDRLQPVPTGQQGPLQ
jgi:hypothetical protein